MNKAILVMLVVLSLVTLGCGKQQNQTISVPKTTLPSQVDEVKASLPTMQNAEQIKQDVQGAASDMAKKAQELLGQAQQYLDQGKLNEAISTAQNVLSFDPSNIDAQKIINLAKEKLNAIVEQKVGDVKSGLIDTVGTTGQ